MLERAHTLCVSSALGARLPDISPEQGAAMAAEAAMSFGLRSASKVVLEGQHSSSDSNDAA
jgi:hypothetical protein